MSVFDVDGRKVILNDREAEYWTNCGDFMRIPEGDDADAKYIELRERIIESHGADTWAYHCPPSRSTLPIMMLHR